MVRLTCMRAVGQSRYDDSGGGQDAPYLHVGGFAGEHTRGAEGCRSQSSTDLLLVVSSKNFLCILKKAPNNFNQVRRLDESLLGHPRENVQDPVQYIGTQRG